LSALLLDASVILAAFDRDDSLHKPARALLSASDVTLATLDLVRYEVTNVAIRTWRAPKLVSPLLEAIERISNDGGVMLSTNALLASAAQVAEENSLSAYNAAYVAAAAQTGGTLVSCDIRDLVSKGLASTPATTHQ
jgi:predicted nucleic acid-binding protein